MTHEMQSKLDGAKEEAANLYDDRKRIATTYGPEFEQRIQDWTMRRQLRTDPDGLTRPDVRQITSAEIFSEKMLTLYDVSSHSQQLINADLNFSST